MSCHWYRTNTTSSAPQKVLRIRLSIGNLGNYFIHLKKENNTTNKYIKQIFIFVGMKHEMSTFNSDKSPKKNTQTH